MKKFTYTLAAVVLLISFSQTRLFAQGVEKGDFLLSPGIGFGYLYAGGVTFGVTGEYAFTDEISGGGYLAYTRWDYGFGSTDIGYNFIDFGARASYHFAKLLKLKDMKFDPYAGAQVGFVSSSFDYDGPGYSDGYNGGIRGGLYAGARYFVKDNIGFYGEVGFALCPIMIGVTFKF
ncbi:MAG: hypothetical protein WKF87_05565 [Chryseolinea sp.]